MTDTIVQFITLKAVSDKALICNHSYHKHLIECCPYSFSWFYYPTWGFLNTYFLECIIYIILNIKKLKAMGSLSYFYKVINYKKEKNASVFHVNNLYLATTGSRNLYCLKFCLPCITLYIIFLYPHSSPLLCLHILSSKEHR